MHKGLTPQNSHARERHNHRSQFDTEPSARCELRRAYAPAVSPQVRALRVSAPAPQASRIKLGKAQRKIRAGEKPQLDEQGQQRTARKEQRGRCSEGAHLRGKGAASPSAGPVKRRGR